MRLPDKSPRRLRRIAISVRRQDQSDRGKPSMEGKPEKRAAIGGRRHERACGVVVRVMRVGRDAFHHRSTLSATKGRDGR